VLILSMMTSNFLEFGNLLIDLKSAF